MVMGISLSGGQFNTASKGSLGGQRSDTVITTDVNENFFDNVSRSEGLVGKTEYRNGYIYNPDATTYTGITLELLTNPTLSQVSIGLDPVGKGDGRTSGIATSIGTEDTTPSGVTFFGEENPDDGAWDTVRIPIGMLRQGECVPFWLKRKTEQGASQTITFNLAINHDAVTLPGETFDDGGAFGEMLKITKQIAGTFLIGTARIGFSEIGPSP
jgi:hypothetical protein